MSEERSGNRAPSTAILLIDHGSRLDSANAMLAEVAALVQAAVGDTVAVQFAHMELAPPDIAAGFAACVAAGATEVVAHPYMLAPGRHATADIPRLVAAAASVYPHVRYQVSAPLGVHPLLAQVVLERCGFR